METTKADWTSIDEKFSNSKIMINNKNLYEKLKDVKRLEPIDKLDYTIEHTCMLPEQKDCFCEKIKSWKKNARRIVLQETPCINCNNIECICSNENNLCFRECKKTQTSGENGALCVCAEVCTCDSSEECYVNTMGVISVPDCTCGWTDYQEKSKKSEIFYLNCTCNEKCECYVENHNGYRIPFIMKTPEKCFEQTHVCEDFEKCYFQLVKEKGLCVCGSGVYFTDCSCFNKEYIYTGKWPPCACGEVCVCVDRKACYTQSRMAKCTSCQNLCICGYKDFCTKILDKKLKCACGSIKDCICFGGDECIYTDKLVRVAYVFTDDIGWCPKPVARILPLQYDKYYKNGKFKTPYTTSIMIKFLNRKKEVMFKHPYQITANINELRRELSIVFKLPLHAIVLKSCGVELHQTLLIAELGYKPYDIIELYLDVKEMIEPIPDYYAMVIPDVITIPIKLDENIHKNVVVEVYDKRIEKPFIGGYRHKKTGVEYHHAYTQTGLRATKISHELQNNRDTQTYWCRNRIQETTYDRATQMTNTEIWIPSLGDRIITPNATYETADEREKRLDVLGKVRTIQRYFRAWKMRKALHALHEEYNRRVQNAELNENDRIMADRKRRQEEIVRKIYPRTRADYTMLYGMLAKWKKAETDRISQTYTKAPRVAELYILLDREIKILNIIEQHRKEVRDDMKIQKDIDFFEEISAPVKWHGYKDLIVEMHTEKSQRGQKYKELYFMLCRRDFPEDQRLTLLLSLKYSLQDHKCRMAMEILSTIDQECELLVRGLGTCELEMLRKRLELLVFEHVKTVQCNDCLTKRYRGTREIRMGKRGLYFCKQCRKLKDIEDFSIHSRMNQPERCTTCSFVDSSSKPYVDIAPYRFMLELIIKDERKRISETESCVIYMINERDIQYIVDRIWHGHSMLTESRDLYELRLARWDKNKPWSPWNCVLLTELEAKAHLDVDNVQEVYGEHVCNDVLNKHLLGRNKFVQMFYVNEFFVKHGVMKDYKEIIDYTPVPSEIFCNELCTEPDKGAPCVSEKCLTSNDPKNNFINK